MPEIPGNMSFDTGIERIQFQNSPIGPALPDAGQMKPIETAVQHQLNDVLYSPSLEQRLLVSIQPESIAPELSDD